MAKASKQSSKMRITNLTNYYQQLILKSGEILHLMVDEVREGVLTSDISKTMERKQKLGKIKIEEQGKV